MKNENYAVAVDAAYIRGQKFAKQVMDISDNILRVKCESLTHIGDTTRSILLKFDISNVEDVVYAPFSVKMINVQDNIRFRVYQVSPDSWYGKTVTYETAPRGELIFDDVCLGYADPIDMAPHIQKALANGEKQFSIRIESSVVTVTEATMCYEVGKRPAIRICNEKEGSHYVHNLTGDEEKNAEIWSWAEKMYEEWYERYQNLPAINQNAEWVTPDESQYTKTSYSSGQSTNYNSERKEHRSRPLYSITDLDQYVSDAFKNAKRDEYGGIMVESMKQKATGYFRKEKIDGRWWLIDPLGYPYISIGLSDIHYSQLGSKFQKECALKTYGTLEGWAEATTARVREGLSFNSSARPVQQIIDVKDGLPFIYPARGVMSTYGAMSGVRGKGNGSTVFTENNTMPVFDPGFASYVDVWAKEHVKFCGNSRLIGYTSDNELPMNFNMLDRSMAVNPEFAPNYYTYACAWTWLRHMTGKDNPAFADITDELRDLFRGFVWDRYLYLVSGAVKRQDPDHMYMGVRFLIFIRDSQWVFRFSAQYLDVMTVNWYFDWEPSSDVLYRIAQYGDMPFVVTEFYAKAGDSGLANTSGAGRYVETQTDRADFYDTYVLKLLESANCVGWQWFQYMDNDPNSGTSDGSSINSNKGIFASDLSEYTVFTDRMKALNENTYAIIDYFKNKKQSNK